MKRILALGVAGLLLSACVSGSSDDADPQPAGSATSHVFLSPPPDGLTVASGGSGSSTWRLVWSPDRQGTLELQTSSASVSGMAELAPKGAIQTYSKADKVSPESTVIFGVVDSGYKEVTFESRDGVTTAGTVEAVPLSQSKNIAVWWIEVPTADAEGGMTFTSDSGEELSETLGP